MKSLGFELKSHKPPILWDVRVREMVCPKSSLVFPSNIQVFLFSPKILGFSRFCEVFSKFGPMSVTILDPDGHSLIECHSPICKLFIVRVVIKEVALGWSF